MIYAYIICNLNTIIIYKTFMIYTYIYTYMHIHDTYIYIYIQSGPQKCPYFSLAVAFKEIFKIFSPQILEVYRILLV